MGYTIQAFVISEPRNHAALADVSQAHICPLNQDIYLIPLTDELFDELQTLFPSKENSFYPEFWKFSTSTESFAKVLSKEGPVIFIEVEYFGGVGEQAAAVWNSGQLVMSPQKAAIGPINEGLKLIGVVCADKSDEFDTVGLGRHRSNEGWIKENGPRWNKLK